MKPEAQHAGEPYRLRRFLRPYVGRLWAVFTIMALTTFLGLTTPWFVQQLIDRIYLARRPDLLWLFAVVFVSARLVGFGLSVLQARVYTSVTSRILLDMRCDFLAHLQTLSLRFFSGTRFGDIIVRFNRDLSLLQDIVTSALLQFVIGILTISGTIAWGLYYDWELFLIALSPLPLAPLLARPFRGTIQRLTGELRDHSQHLASSFIETLTGVRTVRSYGREKEEVEKFTKHGENLVDTAIRFQVKNTIATGLPRIMTVAAVVIVYWVGGARLIRGEISLGTVVALSMYVGMVVGPLMAMVDLYLQLVQARVSLERVRAMRELAPEVVEDPDAPAPGRVDGALAFEAVRFRHRDERPLLEDVSFTVAPGEKIALVGRSGAGKSTIVDLLFRFLDPANGTVRIDGADLRTIDMRSVRKQMAVVAQDDHLFHESVLDNIRYGDLEADRETVLEAAKAAGIDEILPDLDDGLDTIVGERGTRLSGGQRQRISIARALLRRPKILILDEATSSLDYESDRSIREGIERLMGGATTLIVTHRLSSVLDVDRALVVEDGVVREVEPKALCDQR